MVQTSDAAMPYKAVLDFEDGTVTERPFETMKEGEDFIRTEAPVAQEQSREEPPGPLFQD